MQLSQRINAFVTLGQQLGNIAQQPQQYGDLFARIQGHNQWFDPKHITLALLEWSKQLNHKALKDWTQSLPQQAAQVKTIALVLAGNIPLVGFHDILTALISGHKIQCKLSSKDPVLTRYIVEQLLAIEPDFESFVQWTDGPLKNFDAVIATGSNNSAMHFEHYFKNYPSIIRKNRTSVAVLTGQETEPQLQALTRDVFQYYGLGCRNVSKLYVPRGYDFQPFFGAAFSYGAIMQHDKYMNNYDYNKAVYLMGQVPLLDNEFVLLKEDTALVSPIAVVFYQYYDNLNELKVHLSGLIEQIQCIVGVQDDLCSVDFGQAQCPLLDDYADGVNTLEFLNTLKT